ncbi:3-oxoacyl-[acyl-carrier-protein] reductase FabG [Zhongshania aliphaticivorans]|uniref:3-oxoacyl-[acyl-carrier-protein] reductase FabG n=1 Tax=Zhongshania aliphaticivorans TaxID=1470434 RepID=A0A5S9QBF4_9GAMM|nr:pteridine reductase [Zhongshania aliphaticivorans]CAA0114748.1 3-oxoacyl-[acyl-carrier-protein] reductase FabG [Zhongshania aliphaticivorans]CAA0123013.1 3-oxoacyl-[acyl-carrier-protein] reductase FabG [Zhongshania aliphaticivorans]
MSELLNTPVALVTGAGQRLGAEICRHLHARGYRIVIHYRHSAESAVQLCESLNALRANSAITLSADMNSVSEVESLAKKAVSQWQRLDVLVNNASSFYPTPLGTVTEAQWDDLQGSNLKGAFFLAQALAIDLACSSGCIVNMIDIYGSKPLEKYPAYSIAKAGVAMMTQSLALELAPEVRVNGVSPGAILWPSEETEYSINEKQELSQRVPLQRQGEATDIAKTVVFLVADAPYITGQMIAVDGGRSVVL